MLLIAGTTVNGGSSPNGLVVFSHGAQTAGRLIGSRLTTHQKHGFDMNKVYRSGYKT